MQRIWSMIILLGLTPLLHAQTFETGFDAMFCGDTRIIFDKICRNPQPGIQFVHVHENEKTAVQVAQTMIDSLGKGCFVTWQSHGERNVSFTLKGKQYKFDPNRIYTAKGLEATLKANGAYSKAGFRAVQQVAVNFTRQYVDSNTLIVAMHNNTDSGGLHIRSYLPGGDYAHDAAEVNVVDTEDPDDFFYTTEKRIYDYLKGKGFNILLQNNSQVTDDGSLSVYCGYRKIAYLNIETEHGGLQRQQRMMAAAFEMIDTLYQ